MDATFGKLLADIVKFGLDVRILPEHGLGIRCRPRAALEDPNRIFVDSRWRFLLAVPILDDHVVHLVCFWLLGVNPATFADVRPFNKPNYAAFLHGGTSQ